MTYFKIHHAVQSANKKWTYEDLVNQYVRHMLDINDEYVEKSMNKKC